MSPEAPLKLFCLIQNDGIYPSKRAGKYVVVSHRSVTQCFGIKCMRKVVERQAGTAKSESQL